MLCYLENIIAVFKIRWRVYLRRRAIYKQPVDETRVVSMDAVPNNKLREVLDFLLEDLGYEITAVNLGRFPSGGGILFDVRRIGEDG